LLTFFMLTSTFIKASAINVDLPKATTSDVQASRDAVITVYKNGNITLNDKNTDIGNLGNLLKEMYTNNNELVVVIQSDKDVPYGIVIQIMDIVRLTGIKKMSLSTVLKE
ncbi:MAG: biopolymer transporter ExbD, partial [Brevinematales bacterium]|nr:biopolymer transporter ExbD [Brevinematales bacterium]